MYKRKRYLAEKYDVSIRTIERRVVWIKAHQNRYPDDAIMYMGHIPYIREDVFEDAMFRSAAVDAGVAAPFREEE